VEGSYEQGNEPSVSIKYLGFIEELTDWWLLKKGSAAYS
jgi:hypothetical protein